MMGKKASKWRPAEIDVRKESLQVETSRDRCKERKPPSGDQQRSILISRNPSQRSASALNQEPPSGVGGSLPNDEGKIIETLQEEDRHAPNITLQV
ncbi:hypothetical protein Btru_070946 [Bulinus truncatus]|nr:hypothetical protein Btru_070946 [Bulinus truncatus]